MAPSVYSKLGKRTAPSPAPSPPPKKAKTAAAKGAGSETAGPAPAKRAKGAGSAPPAKRAKTSSPKEDDDDDDDDDVSKACLAECERRAAKILKQKGKLAHAQVLGVLEKVPVPSTDVRKNVLPDDKDSVQTMSLGAVTKRSDRNVIVSSKTKARENVTKVLTRFMKEHEPGFKFTSISFNKNYAAKKHKDGNNLGDSRVIGLGKFTGGQLIVEENGKQNIKDIKNKWVKFNGNNFHEVTDFDGTRFSLVFFTLGNYHDISAATAKSLKGFGFNFLDGTKLAAYVKNSKEAHEAQKQTSKDAIKVDLLRLEKAYIERGFVHGDLREFGIKTETKKGVRRITNVVRDSAAAAANVAVGTEVATLPDLAAGELQILSAGYDILDWKKREVSITSKVARIQTANHVWFAKCGLTLALLSPADNALHEITTVNYYANAATAQATFGKMAKRAQKEGRVLVGTAVNTVCKQQTEMPNAFYATLKQLGCTNTQRMGYRRPWAFVAYDGCYEELRGERNELAHLVVKVQHSKKKPILVKDDDLTNMTGSEASGGLPVAPKFIPEKDFSMNAATRKTLDEYKVIIPSYDRPGTLKSRTLATLKRHDMPLERVFVFVANEKELARYSKELGAKWMQRKRPGDAKKGEGNLVVGKKGIREQREFMANWFAEGDYLVSLDDDISDIQWLKSENTADSSHDLKSLEKGNLQKLIAHGGELMLRAKANLWSVNTSANPLSMHPTHISRRAGICNGYCYGFFNRKATKAIFPDIGTAAEDVERSARYFMQDGVVLRYRMVSCKTKCYEENGGLQTVFGDLKLRKKRELEHLEKLAGLYPQLLVVNKDRAQAQAAGGDQRSLPIHFSCNGAAPLVGKKAPWLYPAKEVQAPKAMSSEAVTTAAGRR